MNMNSAASSTLLPAALEAVSLQLAALGDEAPDLHLLLAQARQRLEALSRLAGCALVVVLHRQLPAAADLTALRIAVLLLLSLKGYPQWAEQASGLSKACRQLEAIVLARRQSAEAFEAYRRGLLAHPELAELERLYCEARGPEAADETHDQLVEAVTRYPEVRAARERWLGLRNGQLVLTRVAS